MTSIVMPNLCFPGLDFRSAPERAFKRPADAVNTLAREAFRDDMRTERTTRPVPLLGKFTIDDLTDATCKWSEGDGPFLFCGDASIVGRPYCLNHAILAYPNL